VLSDQHSLHSVEVISAGQSRSPSGTNLKDTLRIPGKYSCFIARESGTIGKKKAKRMTLGGRSRTFPIWGPVEPTYHNQRCAVVICTDWDYILKVVEVFNRALI
jgi:hypothetical protein